MDSNILDIYVNEDLAGHLVLEGGGIHFHYAPLWLSGRNGGISFSLPPRDEEYRGDIARNFFTNLLPEGDVRKAIEERLNIDRLPLIERDFQLLGTIGGECAGAIMIMPHGEVPSQSKEYEPINREDIGSFIDKIRSTPFLAGNDKVSLSLAGAQDKMPVYFDGQDIMMPLNNAPSTHILKPQSLRFGNLVENEAFMMTLARQIGLNVPNVLILNYGKGQNAFLIERYDRVIDGERFIRLMQEDFCQILKLSAGDKYNQQKGSTFEACHRIIEEHSTQPLVDRDQFYRWIAFNAIAGNEDAHSKNISLLYAPEGIKLAPFYDLVNTYTYDLKHGLAMQVGSEKMPMAIQPHHFDYLGKKLGLGKTALSKTAHDVCDRIISELPSLMTEFFDRYDKINKIEEIGNMINCNAHRFRTACIIYQQSAGKEKSKNQGMSR